MISYGRQEVTDTDVDAVVAALRSPLITQGPAVPAFESRLIDYTGAAYAVVANSATSALHLACRAVGLQEGDVLWTSPNTFVATANVARACGADVDFVDIDSSTLNMDVADLARRLTKAKSRGRLPDVVIPVHFGGRSCDMLAIARLSREFDFRVIEDASHAIGSSYDGAPVGACLHSDIAVFSFHAVKTITTGEGGAAVTKYGQFADRMRLLRSHGVTRDQSMMPSEADGPWVYQQVDLGYNYRMTDFQAALGCSQLDRLDDYVRKRNLLADRYDQELSNLPLTLYMRPEQPEVSACHLYVVRLEDRLLPRRREIFERLVCAGVGVNVHYIPVHTQPYYRALGFQDGDFPTAESYYAGAMTLPLHPQLTDDEQAYVIDTLRSILS